MDTQVLWVISLCFAAISVTAGLAHRQDLRRMRLLADVLREAQKISCEHSPIVRGRGNACCRWAAIAQRIEAEGITATPEED